MPHQNIGPPSFSTQTTLKQLFLVRAYQFLLDLTNFSSALVIISLTLLAWFAGKLWLLSKAKDCFFVRVCIFLHPALFLLLHSPAEQKKLVFFCLKRAEEEYDYTLFMKLTIKNFAVPRSKTSSLTIIAVSSSIFFSVTRYVTKTDIGFIEQKMDEELITTKA